MSNNNKWEVFTKSKRFEKKVVAHKEKKKEESLMPKLEEIMPSHEYRKIITGRLGLEKHSPSKSIDSSKSKSASPKKHTKSLKVHTQNRGNNRKTKSDNVRGTDKPKSINQAFRNLKADDFASYLEQLKIIYPSSKLTWLKEVANYLNSNLPFECDPVFFGKPVAYPSNIASPAFKRAVLDFLSSQGEVNVDYFFNYILLETMCTELNRNFPVVGYKFLLQLIAQNWPQICSSEMANIAMLRDSYQNRSNICLSILWAIGQGGYQNLMEGIRVWQNLMVPNLTMRSYSRFITEYIEKILNTAIDQRLSFDHNKFLTTYNTLKRQYSGLPRECQQSLNRSSSLLLQKHIASTNSHANLFVYLLSLNEVNGCISVLLHNDDCFKIWKMNYKKQLVPSINLIKNIETQIFDSASKLATSEAFHKFLREVEVLNAELDASKKRYSNVDLLIQLVKSVQEKTAQQKKKQATEQKKTGGCCKWLFGSMVLTALIAGALFYDTEVNGKGVFAKSATGKALQNAGLLPHVEKAWYTSMSTAARGYKWAEKNLPPYTKPACQLICDLSKLLRNAACNAYNIVKDFTIAKLPVAAQFLEEYVPGLPKKIENTSETVKTVSLNFYEKTLVFFKTQVLVGRLSPANLSQTFNQTQILATEFYNQFHKKVEAYAKLK